MRDRLVLIAVAIVALALQPTNSAAQTSANRDVEPVIMTGADVPAWSGAAASVVCQPATPFQNVRDAHNGTFVTPPATGIPVDEVVAYRWDGGEFIEIPVQVDQLYPYCLTNQYSDTFGTYYSSTDQELTYAWDTESWKKTAGTCTAEYEPGDGPLPDPVPTLDADDEIVFMASDAGLLQPPPGVSPPPGASDLHGVVLVDPLDPIVRYAYLARKPGGSSFNATNGYVSYVRDANADEWIDRYNFASSDPEKLGSSNTGYGPNLSGTVCSRPACVNPPHCDSSDRFVRDGVTVTTPTYQWYASGRWMIRDLHVAKPGQPGTYGPDLIDRWKGRAFQQAPDSTISLVGFEDEQVNWEANAGLIGELTGPVRAIREIWGADSGTNVTNTESFYRDAVTYRYRVRVHPIPPDGLYTSWDYNAGAAARYYNEVTTGGVDVDGQNDDDFNIDSVGNFPAYFDAPDPAFSPPTAILQWEQVSGAGDNGSLVYIVEIKGATTVENPAVVPYYRDDSCLDDGTGDDPVARPFPGNEGGDDVVMDGYCAAKGLPDDCIVCRTRAQSDAGGCEVDCALGETQGAYASHGIHYLVTSDTDNAQAPSTLNEIDAQQWQFTVPTATPDNNIGDEYGNVVKFPLQAFVAPLP